MSYELRIDLDTLEEDSDIFALAQERVVAVSPLSLDLTSRVDFNDLTQLLRYTQSRIANSEFSEEDIARPFCHQAD
jgi:hypothetical protein